MLGFAGHDRTADPIQRASMNSAPDDSARRAAIVRALKRYRTRVARKLEALRGDLAEAERATQHRRFGEALLAYLGQVPARATQVRLPDPADPAGALEIPLDPKLKPQENAARYFKRAAKAERGLEQVPPRLAATEAEVHGLTLLIERAERFDEHAASADGASQALQETDATLDGDLELALAKLPPTVRTAVEPLAATKARPARRPPSAKALAAAVARGEARAPEARLQPRRFKTSEGWDVLIGRTNEGNDYLTHHLARPEDYWFHVHGAAGSHVVLRRGKGKNEPSKRTVEEVAAWAAFYSQARTAGKVPVIVTRKKYVRKPRKAPPGLAVCEREKTVMVRPKEPPKTQILQSHG